MPHRQYGCVSMYYVFLTRIEDMYRRRNIYTYTHIYTYTNSRIVTQATRLANEADAVEKGLGLNPNPKP